ncbi:hypothetical protein L6164_008100 [Bauhinia variegata]|uniref:Uncharacterized protein n=1 Tax=Bauhinia variegata TaxID=167791 RepID=A0ACB9PEP1_BAUVA|nr:hypothetical protein L6164_008100 [Bauhinia variegata]
MAVVTGDRYLEKLVEFVEKQAGPLIEGTLVLKLNPAGLRYVQSRLEALHELESLLAGAPVDYLRAYVSDLGDHRALEQLRRILRLLTSLKVVSTLPPPGRDPTPLSVLPFGRLKVLELRGCDLSTSAAKGLLELRHTLEKIICHNSTDALRHVFASRIAEIKGSPQWNRLSFVSCACNGLLLMDESLQLLPAVETLDLSRNKFAKVDNLQKCTRLKHLDLGFNHLRSIAPFSQVSCHIVKLVLRNNALTTLRGIENLKSLEGLDLSYNIISNFSELEFLEGLSFLHSLWMEGNPLCCARWYRAQVFSFFTYPEKLKLDDKEISTSDFWKRQIIIASKHKQPASFGFYIPAKDEDAEEGCMNRARRKVSRLALIESGEEIASICSDQESVSLENEIQNREDPGLSDDEAEIVDLINRVEHMKKERSVHWLREFKEWMDVDSDKSVENSQVGQAAWHPQKENYNSNNQCQGPHGEVLRYASDSVLASGDESSTNILESDSSFLELSSGIHSQQNFDHRGSLANASSVYLTDLRGTDKERHKYSIEGIDAFISSRSFHSDASTMPGGHKMAENVNIPPLSTGDLSVSHESSACATSPPHYQEDLLHRRQNLVEEILQLSADSYSVASSDSNTSGSEVDYTEFEPSMPEIHNLPNHNYLDGIVDGRINLSALKEKNYNQSQGSPLARENGIYPFDSSTDQTSKQCLTDFSADSCNGLKAPFVNQDADSLDNRKSRKKPKKRVISIVEESSDGNACDLGSELKGELSRQMPANVRSKVDVDITTYFNANIADSETDESCSCYVLCNCVLPGDLIYTEREVAVLLSSHKKLYILLFADATDGSGTFLSLLSCHKVEEVCEVLIGVGLQVARVRFESGETYLFITRSIEKSRELIQTLQVSGSCGQNDRCSIQSLEQVQVELFDHQICGGSNVNIYQYAMVLVCCNNNNDGLWLPRSLFVIGGHVLLCIEDIMQFSSSLSDASLPPYFRIDSCCSVNDIIELVMDIRETYCVTLVLERLVSEFHRPTQSNNEAVNYGNRASGSLKLKLQWFSEDNLWKFVSILKAIHAERTVSPLVVRCTS